MLRKVSEEISFCYQRAIECRAKANDSTNDAARREYLAMEYRWILLAKSYEFSERVADFTNEVERRRGFEPPEP